MTTVAARLWTVAACVALAAALPCSWSCGEGTVRPPPGSGSGACPDASYGATIQPYFDQECQQCHRTGVASGGLDLESHAGTLAGGLSGPSVVPGDCDGSLLYQMVVRDTQPFMPPGGVTNATDVDCLCAWIAAGAPDD